jgi:cell division septation protein DedD
MPRRRGEDGEDPVAETPAAEEMELADEDRLPWLEAVEEDEEESGPSIAKLVAAIVIGLAAIGIIVGGIFWLGNRGGPDGGGDGDLIAAPDGDYKVRPSDPGGMNVAGEGDTAFAASEGAQPKGNINPNAVPEQPVTRPPAQQPAQQQQQPRPQAPAPQPRPAPAPAAPAAGGATIQLGAFSSQAGANRAWTGLAGRFRYLAPLSHSVAAAQVGGRTVYRLRASGAGAADVCRRLRVAGEDCSVVG